MKKEKVYVGIDVAKAHLDVAFEQARWRLSNDARGHRELVERLAKMSPSIQVICEASGGYERALLLALERGGIDFSLVQASRVRQYARACGLLAKTDAIDAQLLAVLVRPSRRGPAKPCLPRRNNCANSKLTVAISCASWWRNKTGAPN